MKGDSGEGRRRAVKRRFKLNDLMPAPSDSSSAIHDLDLEITLGNQALLTSWPESHPNAYAICRSSPREAVPPLGMIPGSRSASRMAGNHLLFRETRFAHCPLYKVWSELPGAVTPPNSGSISETTYQRSSQRVYEFQALWPPLIWINAIALSSTYRGTSPAPTALAA
jgi:hypothetical protein